MRTSMMMAAFFLLGACTPDDTDTDDTNETDDTSVTLAPLAADGTWYGMTYAQRGADWWRFTYEHPVTDHPFLDATGADCQEGLVDGVLYLGGTFAGDADPAMIERDCTVPADTAIYFPVLNTAADNVGMETPMTDEELIAAVEGGLDAVASVHASIDGVAMGGDLEAFRSAATPFSYTSPATDSLQASWGNTDVAGVEVDAYAGGYALMFDPLPAGTYDVNFGGEVPVNADFTFVLDVTYHLTVE